MTKNPFPSVQPWMAQILQAIKKDIKTDHLPADKIFFKTHFGAKPLNKLGTEEIFAVYEKELIKGEREELVEWAINRWVFKHGDAYRFFAERLGAINPNFQEIETLNDSQADQVLAGSSEAIGATVAYLFSRLNGVVFSDAVFEKLHQAALKETQTKSEQEEKKSVQESLEQMAARHQREISRMQEKYEDKLAGVQRKYAVDVEALKKQIRSLQQKMSCP